MDSYLWIYEMHPSWRDNLVRSETFDVILQESSFLVLFYIFLKKNLVRAWKTLHLKLFWAWYSKSVVCAVNGNFRKENKYGSKITLCVSFQSFVHKSIPPLICFKVLKSLPSSSCPLSYRKANSSLQRNILNKTMAKNPSKT